MELLQKIYVLQQEGGLQLWVVRTASVLDLVVEGLDEGEFSSPMPAPPGLRITGYLVVKVLEKMEARQLEFDEIKDMLSQRVLQIEQDKVFSEWISAKMEEYSVEIYPDGLAEIDFLKLRMEGA